MDKEGQSDPDISVETIDEVAEELEFGEGRVHEEVLVKLEEVVKEMEMESKDQCDEIEGESDPIGETQCDDKGNILPH